MVKKLVNEKVGFTWSPHTDADFRVRRTDWSGDDFEILDREEFYALEEMARRFGFPWAEASDE